MNLLSIIWTDRCLLMNKVSIAGFLLAFVLFSGCVKINDQNVQMESIAIGC